MTREVVAAVFVQCRAYDGRKRTEIDSIANNVKKVDRWIESQIVQYKAHKKRIKKFKNHRPRLAYAVRVYLK